MEREEAKEIDRTLMLIWIWVAAIALILTGISCETRRIALALERAYPAPTTKVP